MRTYYGLPVIHKPHWKWLIIVYFFLGGVSSACYVIASLSQLFGGQGGRRIVRAGHYLSLAALLPSPIMLILDLGRPGRFLYMLRVVKLRSPMSLGTWGLTIFGGFCTLSALIQAAEDGLLQRAALPERLLLRLPAKAINALGTLPGFFVGGYTGVLLAITAVPLWARNALLLGPLFLASAFSSGTAALIATLSLTRNTSHEAIRRLERLDIMVLLAELGLVLATHRRLGPVIGRPLRQGHLAHLFRWGVVGLGMVVPLVLQIVGALPGRRPSRLLSLLGSACALSGGFLLRYTIVMAGRESADDPEATFVFTRR